MLRILIADDHEVVRSGLRAIVETRSDWAVVAEAADGKDAIAKAFGTKPDVCIVDYGLPLINGAEVTRQIRTRAPNSEVLMFTMHEAETILQQALEAGARAYLLKSDARAHLLSAIEALARHEPFLTAQISEMLLKSFIDKRTAGNGKLLSPRERVVVQLIAEGHSNRQIGSILNVSAKTVEAHRASAMKRLQVTSAAALIRYAIRNHLAQP
jgi:DNA-binding NarL/FixJ family response regulator